MRQSCTQLIRELIVVQNALRAAKFSLAVSLCKPSLLLCRSLLFGMKLCYSQTKHFPHIVHRPHLVQDRQDVKQLRVVLFVNKRSNGNCAFRLHMQRGMSTVANKPSKGSVCMRMGEEPSAPEKHRNAASCPR